MSAQPWRTAPDMTRWPADGSPRPVDLHYFTDGEAAEAYRVAHGIGPAVCETTEGRIWRVESAPGSTPPGPCLFRRCGRPHCPGSVEDHDREEATR